MRTFPPAADLQCFVGDAIAQVSLDPYGVQEHFRKRLGKLVKHKRVEKPD